MDAVKAAFFIWNDVNFSEVQATHQTIGYITHFFIGVDFAGINYQAISAIVSSAQFKTFFRIACKKFPVVKLILSVGGNSSNFAEIASNEDNRQRFAKFIEKQVSGELKFDGLHLRWLYPATAEEMTNFGKLLTELRPGLPPPLVLTPTVFYSSEYWPSLEYPIQAIVDTCDWINVKGFDLYTPDSSSKLTGPPAPLHNPTCGQLSGDTGVRAWIKAGVEANKLVLGLPFYGHRWRLDNENNHEIFSPANIGADSEIGNEIGNPVPYSRILKFIEDGAAHKFDPSYVTDYCYSETTWIGYDGEDSVKTKVTYAKKKELRGYITRWLGVHVEDNCKLQFTASDAWDNA